MILFNPGGRTNGTKRYKFPPVDIEFYKGERLIRLKYNNELESYAVTIIGHYPYWERVIPDKPGWVYETDREEISGMLRQTITALPRKKDGVIKLKMLKDKWIWEVYDLKNDKLLFTADIKARLKKGKPGIMFGAFPENWEKLLKWIGNSDVLNFEFFPNYQDKPWAYIINETALLTIVKPEEIGMNMPGLGFPGEILEVENKYGNSYISFRKKRTEEILNHCCPIKLFSRSFLFIND